jgi:hypothetical protein
LLLLRRGFGLGASRIDEMQRRLSLTCSSVRRLSVVCPSSVRRLSVVCLENSRLAGARSRVDDVMYGVTYSIDAPEDTHQYEIL